MLEEVSKLVGTWRGTGTHHCPRHGTPLLLDEEPALLLTLGAPGLVGALDSGGCGRMRKGRDHFLYSD